MDEVQKNISKITDQLETLKVNNDQLNSRLSKIERSTTARDFYVSTLEKEIRRVFERQGRALKRLFTRGSLPHYSVHQSEFSLPSFALLPDLHFKVRPGGVAVMIRRELDDARFCVAKGFMTVFPYSFEAAEILNPYELTKTTVEWEAFRIVLYEFYKEHVDVIRSPESQTASVFRDCSADALLNLNADTPTEFPRAP